MTEDDPLSEISDEQQREIAAHFRKIKRDWNMSDRTTAFMVGREYTLGPKDVLRIVAKFPK